eukprot:6488732-Amphidinium_carterae.1
MDNEKEPNKPNKKQQKPKTVQQPYEPSPQEKAEHNVTLPYRDWCKICVKGKSTQRYHKKGARNIERTEHHTDRLRIHQRCKIIITRRQCLLCVRLLQVLDTRL